MVHARGVCAGAAGRHSHGVDDVVVGGGDGGGEGGDKKALRIRVLSHFNWPKDAHLRVI